MIAYKLIRWFLVAGFVIYIYLMYIEYSQMTPQWYQSLLNNNQSVHVNTEGLDKIRDVISNDLFKSLEKNPTEVNLIGNKNNIINLGDDRFVRHCITDEILGKRPNSTQTIKFTFRSTGVVEMPKDRVQSFHKVFEDRAWGRNWDGQESNLSTSGRGSTLQWAQDVIGVLHKVINEIKRVKGSSYKVKLLDVPCGDFVWMNRFLTTRDDIDYTGMDIVPDLIKHHNNEFKNKYWKFIVGDIVAMDSLESFDIILCRMLLQHLLSSDINKVLKLFSKNQDSLLITTNFYERQSNDELVLNTSENPGRFRELNLEIPPYSLSPPACISRDGRPGEFSSPNIFLGIWKLPLRKIILRGHVCDKMGILT